MSKIRNGLLSTVSAVALTATCAAADPLPRRFDWTGFYLGGHAGYGWTEFATAGGPSKYVDGFAGGLLAGYNHQMSNWVVGIEGDWTGTPWKGSSFSVTPKSTAQGRYTDLMSARGRLGYAFDRTLIFGTVGWGQVEGSYSDTKNKAVTDFRHGGTVFGGGFEYKLTRSVSVGIEGLFYDVGFNKTMLSPSAKKTFTINGDDVSVVRARLSVQF